MRIIKLSESSDFFFEIMNMVEELPDPHPQLLERKVTDKFYSKQKSSVSSTISLTLLQEDCLLYDLN